MRKFLGFVIGGIQQKIFNVFLFTILFVSIAFISVIAFQTDALGTLVSDANEKQNEAVLETSTDLMNLVIEENLQRTTGLEAYIAGEMFSTLRTKVSLLGEFLLHVAENPLAYSDMLIYPPSASNDGVLSVQILYDSNVDPEDSRIMDQVGLYGNVASLMVSLYETGGVNSMFLGTADGVFIITDESSGLKLDSEGNPIPFPVTQRFWYKGAVENGGVYFSDIETDHFSGNIGMVCSMPVYSNGKLVAVVGADLFVNSMADYIETSAQEGAFSCIINSDGHVVFAPKTQDILNVSTENRDLRQSDDAHLASFVSDALEGNGDIRIVSIDGKDYYMVASTIREVGWVLISVVDKGLTQAPATMMIGQFNQISEEASAEFQHGLGKSRTTLMVLIGVFFVLGSAAALVLAARIVKPLSKMTKRISEMHNGDLDFEMDKIYKTRDEVEVLANSFAELSARTKNYISEITRITAEKERIGAELNVAAKIQADMLPRIFPPYPNNEKFDLFASMIPAKEVGGDFYDFFLVDKDHIALVMADVSGKGVPAALFMVIAKTLIKDRTIQGGTPAEILNDVNAQLCEGNEAGLFVTVWLAIIDLRTGEGMAANAGHEHPALRHKDGEFHLVEYKHSPAVAVMEGMSFREHRFKLEDGDTLFVYTDGVPEATDKENRLFGNDRMLDALNRHPESDPRTILDDVSDGIQEFIGDAEQFDDTTMLCFRFKGMVD
ncbi:MAG: SpoIIE family protein phosphatase [Spirochaetales bacterium]|nr:SpoIIE family protein phosphatase [Spirochaetales bacterium]